MLAVPGYILGAVGSIPGSLLCCLTSLQWNCCSEVFPIFDVFVPPHQQHRDLWARSLLLPWPMGSLCESRSMSLCPICATGEQEPSSPPCLSFTRVQQDGHGKVVFPLFQAWEAGMPLLACRPSPGQDNKIFSHVPEGRTSGTQRSLALSFRNSSSLRNLPKSQSDTGPVH